MCGSQMMENDRSGMAVAANLPRANVDVCGPFCTRTML
jgi:hypothetical protein